MVKFGVFSDIFGAAWVDVTIALWHKYPNPYSKHVLAEDTIERYVDPATHCLYTTRLLKKKSHKPKWMDPFIGESPAYVVEQSVVDLSSNTMVTYTKNVTLTSYMLMEETCVYRTMPEQPLQTVRNMTCRVSSPVLSLGSLVEKIGFDRFRQHREWARDGLSFVLEKLKKDGRLLGRHLQWRKGFSNP